MDISARDRKLLWGKAGNRCAICRHALVAPGSGNDSDAVIGEEAHIVSRSDDGPRGGQIPRIQIHRYDNYVLLCPTCHTTIDKQVETWTRGKLIDTKNNHEMWIERQLSEDSDHPGPIRIVALRKPD